MNKNENKKVVGRRPKAGLFDEMEYFVGLPKGKYCEVLGELARRRDVKTCLTSSLPLTEFWQPGNLERISELLRPMLPGVDFKSALKFLEFPTDPVYAGRVVGWPSMTDLMILDTDWQIAVEAKFTEYVRYETQTIAKWLVDKRSRVSPFMQRTIFRAWLDMIARAGCTDIKPTAAAIRKLDDVGYQFLHRTASACHTANGPEGRKPVLVYQLFYRKGVAAHVAQMEAHKAQLREWARKLGLKNMKFLIVSVPVTNADEVEKKYWGRKSDLFDTMKLETIYRFDFDGVEIEDVVLEG